MDTQILSKEKLEFLDILKESLSIPRKHVNLIIFTLFTSIPYFFLSVFFEIFLQKTLLHTFKFILQSPDYTYNSIYLDDDWDSPMTSHVAEHISTGDLCAEWINLCLLYLVPCYLLRLLNIIMTVKAVSTVYAAEKPIGFKDLTREKTGLKDYHVLESLITIFHVAVFIALFIKYSEWSAGWNMALVISILEETYGFEAFEMSAYFGKGGNTQRGLRLMLVFAVWEIVLRLPCIFGKCSERVGGISFVYGSTSLICIGNLMKWVVCVVYFFDCKKRILEKKVDEEVGRKDVGVVDV